MFNIFRGGDWNCKGCNYLIFAKKDRCFKCNMDRMVIKFHPKIKDLVIGIVKGVIILFFKEG